MVKDDKNEVICNYCKKIGHFKASCYKLLRKNQAEGSGSHVGTRNGIAGSATDVVLNTMTTNDKVDSKSGLAIVELPVIIAISKKVYTTTQ